MNDGEYNKKQIALQVIKERTLNIYIYKCTS